MAISGNSVAGKSFQMFTVSDDLLAKIVEAVQAGDKEARSSKDIQSFEVFCHGFRNNISLGRLMIVPPAVCSDRQNFPTALLHGTLVNIFGTGGEEIADLIEKRIGESEFDEYSQADFDTLKKEIFVDPQTGEEATLIVFAPNWMNSREYHAFHFTEDAEKLKNNLRHQVFAAYHNPAVSSAFNALMTNVDTTKVDVTDITPKLSNPALTENPLKQYPQLDKSATYKKGTILLNKKTADDITKQTLDPQELDVFEALDTALSNSLGVDSGDGAQGEGGFTAPEAKPGVPREASAKIAHIDANGICPGCKKAGNKCSCKGCTCKQACSPTETPFTNVGPGSAAHDAIEDPSKSLKESVDSEVGQADELAGSPIGIAIDENGVPRREDAKEAAVDNSQTYRVYVHNVPSMKNSERLEGYRDVTSDSEANAIIKALRVIRVSRPSDEKQEWKVDKVEVLENAAAVTASKKKALVKNQPTNKQELSHPETLRVGQDRLSSQMSATFNGGYRDVTATDSVLHPYVNKGLGNNADQAPHAAADHEKMMEAGAYGDDPMNRRSNEKWGSAKVAVKKNKKAGENEDFFRAYVTAALWSTNDNSTPQGGDPLDQNYDSNDIEPNSLAKMKADCDKFQQQNAALLEEAYQRQGYNGSGEWTSAEQAGHDFWLTRNGHGAGFWDRTALQEGGLGDRLTQAAKAFRESDLYVGDDSMIHVASSNSKSFSPSYVASKLSKIVDSDGGYEAMSAKAKKARATNEAKLNKVRSKQAVELDIDSIWDSITEDMGPAPLVDVEVPGDNPAPSNTEDQGGWNESTDEGAEEKAAPSTAPRKRDVQDLPEAFRSEKPEEEKSIDDSEVESQETDLENSATEEEEVDHNHEGSWRVDSKLADFVEDVANEIEDEEEFAPRMKCDQCNMMSIQGVPVHEGGCPNDAARWDSENGTWVKQRTCGECGNEVDADDPCCNAIMEDELEAPQTFGEEEEITEASADGDCGCTASVKTAASDALKKKLHPGRFNDISGKMAAIVGFILGEVYTNPAIDEMAITSDGMVMAQHAGEVGMNDMIGSEVDLANNWNRLLRTAELSTEEMKEANNLYRAAITNYASKQGPTSTQASEKTADRTVLPQETVKQTPGAYSYQDISKQTMPIAQPPTKGSGAPSWVTGSQKTASTPNEKFGITPEQGDQMIQSIRPGVRVTILIPGGMGRNGIEWKEATGKAVMTSSHGGWVLNMGGQHGTPGVASAGNIVRVGGQKRADTADNGVDVDSAANPTSKETGSSATVEAHEEYNTERSEGTDRPKQGADVSGDFSEAKSEAVSVDTVDTDISQPTVSVEEAGAKNGSQHVAMRFMNRYDIEEAIAILGNDPVLGKAARFLRDFMEEVDSHSDGWAYWRPPVAAAGKLMQIVSQGVAQKRGYGREDAQIDISDAAILKAMSPIKAFMTRRGNAAGMQMPKLGSSGCPDCGEPFDLDHAGCKGVVKDDEQGGWKAASDISGDISEAKSEVDYNKAEVADESAATDTVNPEHFASRGDCDECGGLGNLDKNGLCGECRSDAKSAAQRECDECGGMKSLDKNNLCSECRPEEKAAAIGERNDDVPVSQGDIPDESQPQSDLSGAAPEATDLPAILGAYGDEQPESIQFDFGAGDLADIVMYEEDEDGE